MARPCHRPDSKDRGPSWRGTEVNGLLCAASGIGKDGVESYWFWFDLDARTASSLGDDLARADRLLASPDGRYLAVQALSEALTYVDVVDPVRVPRVSVRRAKWMP